MYLSIIFLPLIGSILSGLFGRFLTPRGAAFVTILGMSLACFISIVLFFEVGFSGSPCYIKLSPWLDSEMFDACWGFYFDSLTVSMCFTVTLISTLVHLYSTSYMSHDPHQPRFMAYLSLFTFFMLMLITAEILSRLIYPALLDKVQLRECRLLTLSRIN